MVLHGNEPPNISKTEFYIHYTILYKMKNVSGISGLELSQTVIVSSILVYQFTSLMLIKRLIHNKNSCGV